MSSNQHSIIFEYLLIHLNKLVTHFLASQRNELSSTIHVIREYIDFGPARSFSNGLEFWGIVSLALGLPLLATYIVSMYRFGTATRSMKFGKVVPAIPYLIPAVGHAFSLAWDTTETLSQAIKFSGGVFPVRLKLGVTDITVLAGPDNIQLLWKLSQKLTTKGYKDVLVHSMFGMPKRAVSFFMCDDSGSNRIPNQGSDIRPENRIEFLTHSTITKFLTGPSLKKLCQRFTENLAVELSNVSISYTWQDLPDLNSIFESEVLRAALNAMCGPLLVSLNPDFTRDFFEMENGMSRLAKHFPRWLIPDTYNARDRCLRSIRRWHKFARSHGGSGAEAILEEWDLYYGAKLMRSRQEVWTKMDAMDDDAAASEDLGLIWASAANSIPAAFWMLVHVINDPFLLRRARHEMEKCIVPSTTIGRDSAFDVTALCNNPLLQSIYAETLRLRAFPFLIRSPEREDLSFKEWLLPKSKFILISSYHAQMDENVWNTGSVKDCHPLAEFWADRFLIYPGNGASGPLNPSFRPQPASRPDQADATQETTSKQEEQGEEPIFTTEGLAGAWIPFGGGHRMCPGRHFAKVEIIATFAMMCTMFDIELIGGLPAPNMKEVGWGTLPTSGKTPCRIRRRR